LSVALGIAVDGMGTGERVISSQALLSPKKSGSSGELKAAMEKAFSADGGHEIFESARRGWYSGARPGSQRFASGALTGQTARRRGTARVCMRRCPVSDRSRCRSFISPKSGRGWSRRLRSEGFTSLDQYTE